MSDAHITRSRLRANRASLLCWLVLVGCSSPVHEPASEHEQTDASRSATRAADAGGRMPVTSLTNADGATRAPAPPRVAEAPAASEPADDGCGGAAYAAQQRPLEVLVLFDNSASMILPAVRPSGELVSLWDVAVMELKRFCTDERSRGISLALKYFGTECEADFYSRPDVPMGTLPEHGAAIAASLSATLPLAETATRPALEGALQFMRQRASDEGSGARQVVLLVTDGYPDEADCPDNGTQAVSLVAAQGLAGTPSIATYAFVTVTGIVLDEIARAGGTGKTLLADLGNPGALASALADVRDQELSRLPCEYELPPEYYSRLEPERLRLRVGCCARL